MSSILPNYQYDIFISYRQNDNQEGWVTRFVESLQQELKSLFKEEITLYFDSDPNHGLHETHDVDGSLKEKVKCLVFIPIVSQTYCDPNAFAWQKEFLPFLDFAKQDEFGLDVKVSGGNVSKRVLPVRIHELETEDQKLFEEQIGGVMRPVDFIYKEAGVVRPLRREDSDAKNLNQTNHRNQVNKVARAIKEIISSMRSGPQEVSPSESQATSTAPSQAKSKTKIYLAAAIIALLAISSYFYYGSSDSLDIEASQTSIAVIPLFNNTGSTDLDFFGLGISSEIRTQLAVSKLFDFISSMQATIAYKNSVENPENIGNKLGVTHILTGMYQGTEDNLQGVIELVDASSGKIVWSLPFRNSAADFYKLQASVAKDVIRQFNGQEIEANASTLNLQAFEEFSRGTEIFFSSNYPPAVLHAKEHYLKAIQLDSGFIQAWSSLIELYSYYTFVLPNDTAVQKDRIHELVNYVDDHFGDSWEKKEVIAIYTYYVQLEYDNAKELFHEVIAENSNADKSLNYLSAIYKRELNTQMALQYRSRYMKLNSEDVSSWHELGTIFRNAGDYENSFIGYKYSPGFQYNLKYNENALGDMDQHFLSENHRRIQADQLLLDRRYQDLLHFLNNAKPDSILSPREIQMLKIYAYYGLKKDDSIKIVASDISPPGPFADFLQDPLHSLRPNFLKSSLMAGKSKLSEFFSPDDTRLNQDAMIRCLYEIREIQVAVLLNNFDDATRRLIKVNEEFPSFGDYIWLNRPEFDRIKEEYPPFQEAIDNLKLPPLPTEIEGLKR